MLNRAEGLAPGRTRFLLLLSGWILWTAFWNPSARAQNEGPGHLVATLTESVSRAWFTDAGGEPVQGTTPPRRLLPECPGTFGSGVQLTQAAPVDFPALKRATGLISFWVQPAWNGNDGKSHKLLRLGDPQSNGLAVEKSSRNQLRFVMASPEKRTAARADVSAWRKGEWHHVAIAWVSREGQPFGLILFLDRQQVDGPLAAGNTFLDPEKMPDKRIWIGDESSEASLDELIFRTTELDPWRVVLQDYAQTLPCEKVRITPTPFGIPSDLRGVAGFPKQFGAMGLRPDTGREEDLMESRWEAVAGTPDRGGTTVGWFTSNMDVATVDENGRVLARKPGHCRLVAKYRGLFGVYDLEVINADRPDLDLVSVSCRPISARSGLRQVPLAGVPGQAVVRFCNMGGKPVPAGAVVRFELVKGNPGVYLFPDHPEILCQEEKRVEQGMEPGIWAEVKFDWEWPESEAWLRVTLDPQEAVAEICEANNQVVQRLSDFPVRFACVGSVAREYRENKRMNLVGSFSCFDYLRAHHEAMNRLLRNAVFPETSPAGVRMGFSLDHFEEVNTRGEPVPSAELPGSGIETGCLQGIALFSIPEDSTLLNMRLMRSLTKTPLGLPDLDVWAVRLDKVWLPGTNGARLAGSPILPVLDEQGTLAGSHGLGMLVRTGFRSLLEPNGQLWFPPAFAGLLDAFREGFRADWNREIPHAIPVGRNVLEIRGEEDEPLTGAAVYVYQGAWLGNEYGTFWGTRPKFAGQVDAEGCFDLEKHANAVWDDPGTDPIEGAMPLANPLSLGWGRNPAPGILMETVPEAEAVSDWKSRDPVLIKGQDEGLLLIRIVSGDREECHWLSALDFYAAFGRNPAEGVYSIRTSLKPWPTSTPVVLPSLQPPRWQTNQAPVANVAKSQLSVWEGERFELDAMSSKDPEGQALQFEWMVATGAKNAPAGFGFQVVSRERVAQFTAPNHPDQITYYLFVNDGIRVSAPTTVVVTVAEKNNAEKP